MNVVLLYISPNKTTEKISHAISERFIRDGHSVTRINIGKPGNRSFNQMSPAPFQKTDLLGIGSPVFHMRILDPMHHFLEDLLPSIHPTCKAFIYLTYGGITTGKAFLNTVNLLRLNHIALTGGMKVWAPHFYNPAVYPNPAALQTIDEFYSRLSANHFNSIRWEEARRMFSYQTRRVKLIYPLTRLIAHVRQLPMTIDRQKCVRCKRCVNECPVGALETNPYPSHNRQACLYCYHCVTICPQKAIICPTEKVGIMAERNKKVIGCEQPSNCIYLDDAK